MLRSVLAFSRVALAARAKKAALATDASPVVSAVSATPVSSDRRGVLLPIRKKTPEELYLLRPSFPKDLSDSAWAPILDRENALEANRAREIELIESLRSCMLPVADKPMDSTDVATIELAAWMDAFWAHLTDVDIWRGRHDPHWMRLVVADLRRIHARLKAANIARTEALYWQVEKGLLTGCIFLYFDCTRPMDGSYVERFFSNQFTKDMVPDLRQLVLFACRRPNWLFQPLLQKLSALSVDASDVYMPAAQELASAGGSRLFADRVMNFSSLVKAAEGDPILPELLCAVMGSRLPNTRGNASQSQYTMPWVRGYLNLMLSHEAAVPAANRTEYTKALLRFATVSGFQDVIRKALHATAPADRDGATAFTINKLRLSGMNDGSFYIDMASDASSMDTADSQKVVGYCLLAAAELCPSEIFDSIKVLPAAATLPPRVVGLIDAVRSLKKGDFAAVMTLMPEDYVLDSHNKWLVLDAVSSVLNILYKKLYKSGDGRLSPAVVRLLEVLQKVRLEDSDDSEEQVQDDDGSDSETNTPAVKFVPPKNMLEVLLRSRGGPSGRFRVCLGVKAASETSNTVLLDAMQHCSVNVTNSAYETVLRPPAQLLESTSKVSTESIILLLSPMVHRADPQNVVKSVLPRIIQSRLPALLKLRLTVTLVAQLSLRMAHTLALQVVRTLLQDAEFHKRIHELPLIGRRRALDEIALMARCFARVPFERLMARFVQPMPMPMPKKVESDKSTAQPKSAVKPVAPKAPSLEAELDIGNGWMRYWSEEHKAHYYHHPQQCPESTWTPPSFYTPA